MYILKYNWLSPYKDTCMCVFREDHLTLDKNNWCLLPEGGLSLTPGFTHLPELLCVGMRPHKLFPVHFGMPICILLITFIYSAKCCPTAHVHCLFICNLPYMINTIYQFTYKFKERAWKFRLCLSFDMRRLCHFRTCNYSPMTYSLAVTFPHILTIFTLPHAIDTQMRCGNIMLCMNSIYGNKCTRVIC